MNMYRGKKAPVKAKVSVATEQKSQDKKPKLEEFIKSRDYTGAICLLEFQKAIGEVNNQTLPWLAYAAFHLGDYQKALDIYEELLRKGLDTNSSTQSAESNIYNLYAAACHFYLGNYTEAEECALKVPDDSNPKKNNLKTRILFHTAHKQNDEAKLMTLHTKMTDSTEDQLSLASIHYLRNHFQEATDIYKRLLIEYRDYLALQVYVACCYYKLDYYDVSLEILLPYLTAHPDSPIAINLKACNHYKLYDGKAAEQELKGMLENLSSSSSSPDNALLKHNLVVFRNGENALQVLPPLLDIIPEARLNLVIYYLKHGEIIEAFNLIKDVEPTTPQEYILKGVVYASMGQGGHVANSNNNNVTNTMESKEHLKMAQQFFQLVGASASECDTIPGRQCMASCFFLLKQFEDVLIYLNSIKAYSLSDPIFHYNHGVALASSGQFKEAEEAFAQVNDDNIRNEYTYLSWLARCYIMNGKPRDAWDLYLKMDSNTDSFSMLILIANDCYKVGQFYFAAKAYDVLERLDPSAEYWEGKRSACCGVFQSVIARQSKKEDLRDVIVMLRNNANSPQSEFIVRVMKKWANDNGLNIP